MHSHATPRHVTLSAS
ncbi:hypothetical protein E2C01_098004 [Portunus trituberculatus]|uniref:Uncharacterized protein n=1 Tax=Portunus trituberculatus TaxID=210409 RepID=A0A5B7K744_PORTR|nr:hypothetical protein [Portunus trituberculatus]